MTQTVARRTAKSLVETLPADKLQVAVDFLTYLRTKEEWDATLEILQNPALMRSVRRGRRDVHEGRWVRWQDLKRRV